MINRLRDIRRQKGMTLADVAARCDPPTTAQTIGRLETGTRNLSLVWMNKIAAALGVEPEMLVRGEEAPPPRHIARLNEYGVEALNTTTDAILPIELESAAQLVVLSIDIGAGEYRPGDQVWLREHAPEDYARLLNRDVLAPRSGGRLAFGRLIELKGDRAIVLPPGSGKRQVEIDSPDWLALAEMLVRRL